MLLSNCKDLLRIENIQAVILCECYTVVFSVCEFEKLADLAIHTA